jgi:2-oxo-3-(phosphooxy)propyl 3-oxoalkanoate synthase
VDRQLETAADIPRQISFAAPPPPELLHQRLPEEIFLTDLEYGDDGVVFAARLPLVHARYSDTPTPYHDVLVLAEAICQSGVVSAVNMLGVPADWEFIVRSFGTSLDPLENNRRLAESVRLTSRADDVDVRFRPNGSASAASLKTQNELEGRPSGSSHVNAFWMPAEKYRDLRERTRKRHTPGERTPPTTARETLIGRNNPANSVLSTLEQTGERSCEAEVIVDIEDPTFFGRPLDHLGGLLLCEAARQAATAAICRQAGATPGELVISGVDVTFVAFAELDDVTRCRVEVGEDESTAAVEFTQSGRAVSRAQLAITRL